MSRHLSRALLILGFSVALLAPAHAQTPRTGKPLTLEAAVAQALKKNFDIQIQAVTSENARETFNATNAIFDPTLTSSILRSVSQAASNTSRLDGAQLEGPRNDGTTLRAGVSQRLAATHGVLGLAASLTRSATNSSNALVNPSFGNGLTATLSQPLLRNVGRESSTSASRRAKLGIDIASLNYTSRVLTVIFNTETAYYNLVSARETVRIRQLTLERNQNLFEENTARRATGVMTDLDVLSAEVGVANARRALVIAEQTVADREDALLNLINLPEFETRLGPVGFDDYKGTVPSFATSYKLARERYPDSLSQVETIKQFELDLITARKNLKPTLTLDAALGYTAKATKEGYGQAIANIPNDHGNNWSLGVNYSMPWGQQADKANYRSTQNTVRSQKVRLEQLEQLLLVNVRGAVRAVETQLIAVEIAAKATELSARQYDLQKARFDAGLSTARLVLQAQEDLETARFNELTAKVALRNAYTDLSRWEASSLDRYKVQLPQP
jgi:outer membrane protein TolC